MGVPARRARARIDRDARVHGRLNPVGYPTFAGKDIYFSGTEQLRRIRNIVPNP
jgi:hypothetical protein